MAKAAKKFVLASYTGDGYGGGVRTTLFMMDADDFRVNGKSAEPNAWKVIDQAPKFERLVGFRVNGLKANRLTSNGQQYHVFSDRSLRAI